MGFRCNLCNFEVYVVLGDLVSLKRGYLVENFFCQSALCTSLWVYRNFAEDYGRHTFKHRMICHPVLRTLGIPARVANNTLKCMQYPVNKWIVRSIPGLH